MRVLRSTRWKWCISAFFVALLFASGCKKSEALASDPPQSDQATPRDTLTALFGLVRHYDDDPSSMASLAASTEARSKLVDDLKACKKPLPAEENDVARLFVDCYRAGVLFDMLFMQKLVDIVGETPHGDSVEVRTKVTTALGDVKDSQQVFLFELRKKGANWAIEDFKVRAIPDGVYARWHKETGK